MFRCITTERHFSCFPQFCRRLTHPTGLFNYELRIAKAKAPLTRSVSDSAAWRSHRKYYELRISNYFLFLGVFHAISFSIAV
jgi:hypothetical protein